MREVFIVGVGMTPFGKHPDKSCADLARAAVKEVLADAGASLDAPQIVFYANTAQGAIEGQYGMKGQHALRAIGMQMPLVNIENACSGSTTALNLAYNLVAGGSVDVALAVGTEKLYTDDKARKLATFGQPEDLKQVTRFVEGYMPTVADVLPPPEAVIDEKARSIFLDAYAINARAHIQKYGTTWRQIAAVSAKNHHHSTMNPLAQFQKDYSIEEVLAARVVAWPMTLPMCAPISDGAAATLICSREALARFSKDRAVRIAASIMRSGTDRDFSDRDRYACRLAAQDAYAQAGIGPADIGVAEVHDGSAFAEIYQVEAVGLCDWGQGGPAAEAGELSLGGRIPVNVSGGLESKGHPVAATGLGQIHELTLHLRGEAGKRTVPGVRYAMAVNGGGFFGVEEGINCVTILGHA